MRIPCFHLLFGLLLIPMIHAESNAILDLQTSSGGIVDKSSYRRTVETINVVAEKAGDDVTLLSSTALSIAYNENDPLFGTGAFTFIIKCKFSELDAFPRATVIAGRWDAVNDGRAIGFCMAEGTPGMQFLVNSDGRGESTTRVLVKALPSDQWLLIAGRYNPGQALGEHVYDAASLKFLDGIKNDRKIPTELFRSQTAFAVGAPPVYKMGFSRLTVWNRYLSDGEMRTALDSFSGKGGNPGSAH